MTAPADHPNPAPDPLAADGSTIANIAPAPAPLPLVSGDAPPTSAAALPAFPGMQVLAEVAPGIGGMGMVFKAREISLDRIVAVKTARSHLLTPEGREFFLREARAAAKLDHPNILRIYLFNPEHQPPFYVMQYIEGRSLDLACAGREPRSIAATLEKIARALAYAHAQGIVHRDIKPDNILVDLDGEPHIADFGLAGPLEDTLDPSALDATRTIGTPAYIAPEVYAGQTLPGRSADIYSLGVTIYRLLTGRLPFSGRTLDELRKAICETEPPLPQEIRSKIPEALQRICLKAMERDPALRYESALELAEDLRRFREDRPVLARPTRYFHELRGRLQNHLTDIQSWHEQNLITTYEMDWLSRPYRTKLEAESPWHELSRRFPWETMTLRIGGWLVVLSSILWPAFYWPQLTERWQRILAVAIPTFLINAVGWVLHRRHSRVNALIYLSTGAILLPLLTSVLLVEYQLAPHRQGMDIELFDATAGSLAPSNLQATIAAATFVLYCLLLLIVTRARVLALWLGVGVYLLYTAALSLLGLKYWLNHDKVARALLEYLCLALLFWPAALAMEQRESTRPWAGTFYACFALPFIVCFSLLAHYGPVEWFHADQRLDSEPINLWLMADGLLYFLAALWSNRSRYSYIRSWGNFLMLLVPAHLIAPTHALFNSGRSLWKIGGQPFTTYELACGLVTLLLVMLGTRLRRNAMALPALFALAIFVFRVTYKHFEQHRSWPLALALAGGAAMAAAMISLTWRARKRREGIM